MHVIFVQMNTNVIQYPHSHVLKLQIKHFEHLGYFKCLYFFQCVIDHLIALMIKHSKKNMKLDIFKKYILSKFQKNSSNIFSRYLKKCFES